MSDIGLVESVDYSISYDQYLNGSVFKQNGDTYKQYIEDLQRTYQFLTVSDGGVIQILPIDGYDGGLFLTDDDLGAREYGDSLPDLYTEIRSEENELPTSVIFDYANKERENV